MATLFWRYQLSMVYAPQLLVYVCKFEGYSTRRADLYRVKKHGLGTVATSLLAQYKTFHAGSCTRWPSKLPCTSNHSVVLWCALMADDKQMCEETCRLLEPVPEKERWQKHEFSWSRCKLNCRWFHSVSSVSAVSKYECSRGLSSWTSAGKLG